MMHDGGMRSRSEKPLPNKANVIFASSAQQSWRVTFKQHRQRDSLFLRLSSLIFLFSFVFGTINDVAGQHESLRQRVIGTEPALPAGPGACSCSADAVLCTHTRSVLLGRTAKPGWTDGGGFRSDRWEWGGGRVRREHPLAGWMVDGIWDRRV